MAKPELNDGFTRIANEILGALSRINLSAYETSVLLFIFRNTYGWQRKEDLLALEFIAKSTGIKKPNVCRALRSLKKKNMIITRAGEKGFKLYGFQKDYEVWNIVWRDNEPYKGITSIDNGALSSKTTVIDSDNNLINSDNNLVSRDTQQRKTKERYKENHHHDGTLSKEITEREKTIAAFVKLYVPSPPGVEVPYHEYPSSAILDDVDLLAALWGDKVVQDAIATAVAAGKTKVGPKYLSAIIQRWHKEGKVKPKMNEREYRHYEETR